MEVLAGLSCLPMTCGRKLLLRDSPPGLLWDSSLLCQAHSYCHVQQLTASLPQRPPNTSSHPQTQTQVISLDNQSPSPLPS